MERLSSCYFCGDAVDAAIEEYPLVRSARYDLDTDQRIVLCPSCRRKLTSVIERVLESAFDEDAPDPEDVSLDAEEGDPEAMTATEVETVDVSMADIDAEESVEVDDETEEDDDPLSAGGFEETPAENGAERDGPEAEAETESAEENDDEPAGDDGEESDPAVDDDEQDTDSVDDGDEERADAESDEQSRDYEKAEFNKVVRLLQNREFPVDIDELVVVASSAYTIDEPTTHAIIDALIDRGVVVDNGDELDRPQ